MLEDKSQILVGDFVMFCHSDSPEIMKGYVVNDIETKELKVIETDGGNIYGLNDVSVVNIKKGLMHDVITKAAQKEPETVAERVLESNLSNLDKIAIIQALKDQTYQGGLTYPQIFTNPHEIQTALYRTNDRTDPIKR